MIDSSTKEEKHQTPDNAVEFSKLLNIFANLIQGHASKSVPDGQAWKNDGQVLLIKVYRHLESIEILFKGVETTVDGITYPRYVDHSSIAVLGRAAFESYMMFYFIFCSGSEELCMLRYRVWKMIGLKERQKLNGPLLHDQHWAQILRGEEKEISSLDKLIRVDRLFVQYQKELQEKVLKKDDVRMGFRWMDIAEQAGFPRKYAFDIYSHFCNYAHSGAISVFQIRDASNDGFHKNLAANTITFCTLLMSQAIMNYARVFDEVSHNLKNDPEMLAITDRWHSLLAMLGRKYQS